MRRARSADPRRAGADPYNRVDPAPSGAMGKLLILLLAALAIYFLWRGFKREDGARESGGAGADGERMVDCSHCGVHLPVSEAIQSHEQYFCCEDHRRLFNR